MGIVCSKKQPVINNLSWRRREGCFSITLARGLCYQLLNLLLPDLFVEDSVMLWLRFFVGLLYFYSPSFASL